MSLATAEKFGKEGFIVGLINRNAFNDETRIKALTDKGMRLFDIGRCN